MATKKHTAARKKPKIDPDRAASSLCEIGLGIQAMRAVIRNQQAGGISGEMASICVDTMAPELLRHVDAALAALDESVLGEFSETGEARHG